MFGIKARAKQKVCVSDTYYRKRHGVSHHVRESYLPFIADIYLIVRIYYLVY